MAHIERTAFIRASVATVYDMACQPDRLVEWWPNLSEVRNASADRLAQGVTYDWTYRFKGVPLKGSEEVVEAREGERLETKSTAGQIDHRVAHFFRAEGGGTRYTLIVDYTPPPGFFGRLVDGLFLRRFNEREADAVVLALRQLCETRG